MTKSIFETIVLTEKHHDFLTLITSDEYLKIVKEANRLRKERQKDSIVNKPISQKLRNYFRLQIANDEQRL